jgi:hypothetical protein
LAKGTLAVVDVDVIPMTADTVLRGSTVLVRDGRIAELGPTGRVRIPSGAVRINGKGKFLIPGLADMHTHLYSDGLAPDSVGPSEMGVFLANGITAARLMIGTPRQLQLRKDIEAGRLVGPQLWSAGPQLAGRNDENTFVVTTPDEARAAVDKTVDGGYDYVKITNYVARPVYDAIIDQANRRGIRVDGHVNDDVGLARVLETGQGIQHLDGYFEAALSDAAPTKTSVTQYNVYTLKNWESLDYVLDAKLDSLGGATARAGAWSTPTLTLFNVFFAIGESEEEIRGRPDWQLIPDKFRTALMRARTRYWNPAAATVRTDARRKRYVEIRNRAAKAISDSGGKILVGSDAPDFFMAYGYSFHRELQSLVEAGLTPYQTLVAATRNAAEYLGASKEWGSLEKGKRADFVLLDANPLVDIKNSTRIQGVAIGGRWIERAELDRMVDKVARMINGPA